MASPALMRTRPGRMQNPARTAGVFYCGSMALWLCHWRRRCLSEPSPGGDEVIHQVAAVVAALLKVEADRLRLFLGVGEGEQILHPDRYPLFLLVGQGEADGFAHLAILGVDPGIGIDGAHLAVGVAGGFAAQHCEEVGGEQCLERRRVGVIEILVLVPERLGQPKRHPLVTGGMHRAAQQRQQ